MKIKRIANISSKIAIITMIVMLLSLMFINTTQAAIYSYTEGYIWGFTWSGPVHTQLTTGGTVELAASRDGDMNGTQVFSVLEQPNIFCLENGKSLTKATFSIGEEKTVSDPMLAYILYNGPDMGYMEGGGVNLAHQTEASQNALWRYIFNGGRDYGNLPSNLSSTNGSSVGDSIYNLAYNYAQKVNTPTNITITENEDKTKITVGVSGYYERYDVYINGTKIGTNITEVDISNYDEDIKVNVKAYGRKYTVKYRILTAGGQQRILVITKKVEDQPLLKEISKTVIVNTNVSLQKYITHVNDTAVTTSRINRKADENTTDAIYIKADNTEIKSSGTNKINDIVKIEAGDYVTYNISVYNDSKNTARKVVITDTLPKGVTKYSINGGTYETVSSDNKFTYTINNLEGYKSRSFTVKVYFGEYSPEILINTAEITSNNKTIYREKDSDYVAMKEYKVSLEKYILAVGRDNLEGITDTEDLSEYYDIINYLKNNNINNIQTLINKWSFLRVTIDKRYDLNGDGRIDEEDYTIFKLNNNSTTSESIQSYINADLNNDGIVNSTDLNIYKIIKANLNNDTDLNNNDRYMYILKNIYENDMSSEDALYYLRIKRLMLNTNMTKEEIDTNIDNHLKSDVNDDGIVNSEDNYQIVVNSEDKKAVMINGQKYDINISEYIQNIEENFVKSLNEYINQYDLNNDQKLDSTEIQFLNDYKERYNEQNKYYNINNFDYLELVKLKEEFIQKTTHDIVDSNIIFTVENEDNVIIETIYENVCDYTGDEKITFEDYLIVKEMYDESIYTTAEGEVKADETLEEILAYIETKLNIQSDNENFNENLDFDKNNIIDYTDYEILTIYLNFLEYCDKYIDMQWQWFIDLTKDEINDLLIIKKANDNYDHAYDMNNDEKIDYEDYALAKDSGNQELFNVINDLLTYTLENYPGFIDYNNVNDLNEDGKVDYSDYEYVADYYIYPKIDETINEITHRIEYYSIFDEDVDNKDFSQEDINAIKVYKGWKIYNTQYHTDAMMLYDIDENGIINENDKELIKNYYTKLDNINSVSKWLNSENINIDEFISLFDDEQLYDKVSNLQIDTIINSYDALSEIIDEIAHETEMTLEEILSNEDYKVKVSNTSYDAIVNANNISDVSKLDIDNDGIITEEDRNLLNSVNNKQEITEFNKDEVIAANDINGDGYVDQSDITFYNNLKAIENNDRIKQAINNAVIVDNLSDNQASNLEKERKGKAEYLTVEDGKYVDNTDQDTAWTQHNTYKYDNLVDNVNEGDTVIYKITVRNDGETYVYITEIEDYWNYFGDENNTNSIKCYDVANTLLAPGESASFTVKGTVTESNMSLNIIKNTAKITKIKNTNNIEMNADQADQTPFNNKDADYFQMRDIKLSGNVWNDKALNKTQDKYDALFNNGDENGLEGIKVSLYRVGTNNPVASKFTDKDGNYTFTSNDLIDKTTNGIKGTKVTGEPNRRWTGTYHSYYIVFEYDGITYTSTPDGTACKDITSTDNYHIDSNAREDNNLEAGIGVKSREEFNANYDPVNNKTNITYTYENETGYIPQSIHKYDSNMVMKASTNCINLKDLALVENIESKLQYIGLGLRGRDIFDLELTSDVDNIKITVNGKQGVYKHTNVAEFRKSDSLPEGIAKEDMKTNVSESTKIYWNKRNQEVRESDYNVDTREAKYNQEQGISYVEVTYKITVKNTSITPGTATKITNYYDSRFEFKELIADGYEGVPGKGGNNYKAVIITNNSNAMLNQAEESAIYVVYTLNNPAEILSGITKEGLPTYNMAEITEYKTAVGEGQTQHTKGLIDKDSAPGSVDIEKVRLSEGNSNLTTLQYYFGGNDLSKLKYEDDTYATPTIFITAMDNKGTEDTSDDTPSARAITGTVFEDYTTLIGDKKDINVKTGDGKQDTTYNFEPGIQGITVELYEKTEDGDKLRYTTETNENGEYTFSGYLPGNYFVKYYYGNKTETFLVNDPNTKSYNGEDFQSTNNTGKAAGKEEEWIGKLNDEENYWYVYNETEGVSTATDISSIRREVSTNVTGFTDSQMTVLNNARDGMNVDTAQVGDVTVESIINATKMEALTKPMELTMERSIITENGEISSVNTYTDYVVRNMNFGIAEVPVATIDLQKHVHSFTIKDSAGVNMLAAAEVDTKNTSVVVNPSKIAPNRLETVIKVLSSNLKIDEKQVRDTINYEQNKSKNENVTIAQKVDEQRKYNLETAINNNSLAREIRILYGWKVTAGNIIAAPGTAVLDVSIEDEKLQGAKLEITYEISANIYAEKNFNNEAVTVPTIRGMVDYIDNDLSYNPDKGLVEYGNNSQYWTNTTYDNVQQQFTSEGNGTLDPDGNNYSTVVAANENSDILQEKCGKGVVYITLEKVLSSTDSTLADIIISSVDSYEYNNSVEITKLDYENQADNGGDTGNGNTTGGDDMESDNTTDKFVFKDRVRTPDRFIIVPGMSHDSQAAEIITIHPPTGDSSISTIYYVIAAISLMVIAVGIFSIKKFVINK